jgi:hypothetical protein
MNAGYCTTAIEEMQSLMNQATLQYSSAPIVSCGE